MAKKIVTVGVDDVGTMLSKYASNFDELYANGGAGYKIPATDDISENSWWTNAIENYSVFVIEADFDLGGKTVTLPAGVTLVFNGGVLSNGTINGTNSIFTVQGLRQCFATTLTLGGTWLVDYITPQHYGAVTNANTGLFNNDCTAIIQKCLDSIFTVYIPMGFYYCASGLVISKPKTIVCDKGKGSYADAVVNTPTHTRLYTNQNIDVVTLRESNIKIYDIIIDLTRVATYSKSGIIFDLNYSLDSISITGEIHGSRTRLTAGTNTGNGVYANLDTINAVNSGHSYYAHIDMKVYHMKIGVNIPAIAAGGYLNNMSLYAIKGEYFGNKQDLVLHHGELCKVDAHLQGAHVCTLAEHELYAVDLTITKSVIDIMMADYTEGPVNNFYSPQYLINKGDQNCFIGKCVSTRSRYNYVYKPNSLTDIDNPRTFTMNLNMDDRSRYQPVISPVQNQFAYFLSKIVGSKVAVYDGAGYDFDANLDDSTGLPVAASLTPSIALSNFNKTRIAPIKFRFLVDGAKRATDFLEIVIPASGNNWHTELNALDYYLSEIGCKFNRIQTILKYSGSDVIKNQYPPVDSGVTTLPHRYQPFAHDQLITGGLQKIVIRFIGGSVLCTTNEWIVIHEIFGRGQYNLYPPMIDIGGGQIIYGSLTVRDGVKETLSVYADNTAAKAGGLVAGDPYRTATGVRMVVY